MTESADRRERSHRTPKGPWWRSRLLRLFVSLLIIGAGAATAVYLKRKTPIPRRRPPARLVRLVEVESIEPVTRRVVVAAMGTVLPARELSLKSRVSGEVVSLHPQLTPGGFLAAGEVALRIDPKDYELALAQKRSALARAEYELKLELGHQDVARREWRLLNKEKPAAALELELALRKPHLEKARAELEAARAELRRADLELERTRIRVPFNAMVRSKTVELGSQVTPQEPLAELTGTDAYWIQVTVPVDRLDWIQIPRNGEKTGAAVHVFYAREHEIQGRIVRLLGDLSAEGRMARLLVEVRDPLDLHQAGDNRPPLLIGEYVRAKIEGLELRDVFEIPRTAIRDDSRVWIAGPDDRLVIRTVTPVWREPDSVLVAEGLRRGDRVIVSDLPGAVKGMPVRVESAGAGGSGNTGPDGKD